MTGARPLPKRPSCRHESAISPVFLTLVEPSGAIVRRLAAACLSLCLSLLPSAAAQSFSVPEPAPRSSIKVERITPEMMFEICGFEQQDAPFFLDHEYLRAIAEYNREIGQLPAGSSEATRLAGLRDALKECRENDLNKRYVVEASRSCKALTRAHLEAAARAHAAIDLGWADPRDVAQWGERFRKPLEKCLKSMRCRLDNRKDMAEALDVYRSVVVTMQGWTMDIDGVNDMKICGVTVRDMQAWCGTDRAKVDDPNNNDICTNPQAISLALRRLQPLGSRLPQSRPGGTVPVEAPR